MQVCVEGVERSLNSFNCYSCYSSRKSQKWCLWLLHNTAYRVLLLNLLLMLKGFKVSNTLYIGPLTPPRGKAIYLKAFHLLGLAVHHQSVRGGSFVKFLGLIKLQGWLQARHTANTQFLKLRGTQQPGNSYISTTKLHPPYPNQNVCLVYQFRSKKCLQCLKNVGLYNSFGVGRFSFWQRWFTWASRSANWQASASNAGVPGDPNLPESNCLYLGAYLISQGVVLLVSLLHSHQNFGMTDRIISM